MHIENAIIQQYSSTSTVLFPFLMVKLYTFIMNNNSAIPHELDHRAQ